MTVDISKGVVTPHEAFCRILADWKHPCVRVFPDLGKQIVNRHWWRENAGRPETTIASAAKAFLLASIKDGKIGLCGFSDNSSPGICYASTALIDVSPVDLSIGDMDLFEAKLKCDDSSGGARRYSNVRLSVADLEQVLAGLALKPGEARPSAQPALAPAIRKPKRASPATTRARNAMLALYNGVIPPQDEVSTPKLEQDVNKHLKKNAQLPVSRTTIERASNRHKDYRR